MIYYSLIKGVSSGYKYHVLKRSYYSKEQKKYVDASSTFIDANEYDLIKDTFNKNNIKYKEFDNSKGDTNAK